MQRVKFENSNKKELSRPIDFFKRLPKDTLGKLSKIEKKGLKVNE